jgi:hypothetical protein
MAEEIRRRHRAARALPGDALAAAAVGGVKYLRGLIRLKRIYNFDAPCIFLHHLLSISLHFVEFLCILWN